MSASDTISHPYDQFIAALKARKIYNAGSLIQQMLGDCSTMAQKYAQVGWFDGFSPVPSAVVLTATESQNKDENFYNEILTFLNNFQT